VFRRILVGYDGSEDSAHALRVALDFADGLDGEIVVLSIVRPSVTVEADEERIREQALERATTARELETYRTQADERSVRFHHVVVEASDPATALAAHAKEHGFDLLVVGSHGREQISHLGIGNAVEKLLRARPCPILIV
jgi:universal stress protein A